MTAVAVKAELLPACCHLASLPRDRWIPLLAALCCHLSCTLPLLCVWGGLHSTAAGSSTNACSLETTDLTCSELNFPCPSGWGLITFVIPLYGREAEGMGDSLGPLQHLDLASALLHHTAKPAHPCQCHEGSRCSWQTCLSPSAGYWVHFLGQHPKCCQTALLVRVDRTLG